MYLILKSLLLSLFLFLPITSFAEDNVPLNNLTIRFDLENHTIRGVSKISLPAEHTAAVNLSGLKILSASINDRALIIEPGVETITFSPGTVNDVLRIEYEAKFKSLSDTDNSKNPYVVQGNLISPEGIALIDG